MFSKIIDTMNEWVGVTCVLILASMVAVVFMQASLRYVFNYTIFWAEELARFLQIWMIFLGSALAFEKLGHVNVPFFINRAPSLIKVSMFIFVQIATLCFLFFLIYKGIFLVNSGWIMHSTALDISLGYIYAAAPVSGLLMFLNVAKNTAQYFVKQLKKEY